MKNATILIFAALSHEEIKTATKYFEQRHYAPGDLIFKEGEPGNYMALVDEGRVAVLKSDVEIAIMGVGRSFGEMAMLESRPRSATCKAMDKVSILVLSNAQLKAMMRDDGVIAAKILESIATALAGRLRRASNMLNEVLWDR